MNTSTSFEFSVLKAILALFVILVVLACAIAYVNGTGIAGVPNIIRGIFEQALSIARSIK